MSRFWTCTRQAKGEKCGARNGGRNRKCIRCGKDRPKRREPAHKLILNTVYDEWAKLYGDACNICGRSPSARRRLDRDHDHTTGKMRGLLCARCNRALPGWVNPEWLRKAADYLERSSG